MKAFAGAKAARAVETARVSLMIMMLAVLPSGALYVGCTCWLGDVRLEIELALLWQVEVDSLQAARYHNRAWGEGGCYGAFSFALCGMVVWTGITAGCFSGQSSRCFSRHRAGESSLSRKLNIGRRFACCRSPLKVNVFNLKCSVCQQSRRIPIFCLRA